MQHDPESTDEELEPIAVQPNTWEKTSLVTPDLAPSETLDTGLDKTRLQPSSHRIKTAKLRGSNHRRIALNRYVLGVMISTVSPSWNGGRKQEIDEKRQVKEELMTETAKFRSTKN